MKLGRLAVVQLAAEQRVYWRNYPAAFFTFLLPILVLVFVGGLARSAKVDGEPYANFFVPGMLAMAVVVTTFGGLSITLVIRRESGVLKRVRGTPLPPALYLGALIASVVLVLAVEAAVVLAVGRLAFDVPAPARLWELLGLVVVGAVCFSAMGVALARFVPNAEGSSAIVNAVYLPMLFLSGAFFKVSKLPSLAQDVADALPLTHLLAAMRVAFRGGGAIDRTGLLVVLLWGVLGVALAIRAFSWEPNGQ